MKLIKFSIVIASVMLVCSCKPNIETITQVEDKRVPVQTQNIESGDIYESVLAIGSIEAGSILAVETQGSGTVENLNVSLGDEVKKGDILFTLDSEDIQNTYRLTESQLRTARDNAKVELDDATEQYNNIKSLFENGGTTQSELDAVENRFKQAKNRYEDAIVSYTSQKNNLKLNLQDRRIKAPIDGRISIIYIKENETVGPKVALEIINETSMIFKTEVTGDIVEKLDKGTKVKVYPDGEKEKVIIGEVIEFNQRADLNTGLFEVKVGLEENLEKLKTGEYSEGEFIIGEKNSKLLPKKAILGPKDSEYIYIANDGKVVKKEVKTGISFEENIEILSEISSDAEIIIRGQNLVEEGDQIVIKK